MAWLKGTSTENHRFSDEIWDFPVIFPFNQSIDGGKNPPPGVTHSPFAALRIHVSLRLLVAVSVGEKSCCSLTELLVYENLYCIVFIHVYIVYAIHPCFFDLYYMTLYDVISMIPSLHIPIFPTTVEYMHHAHRPRWCDKSYYRPLKNYCRFWDHAEFVGLHEHLFARQKVMAFRAEKWAKIWWAKIWDVSRIIVATYTGKFKSNKCSSQPEMTDRNSLIMAFGTC